MAANWTRKSTFAPLWTLTLIYAAVLLFAGFGWLSEISEEHHRQINTAWQEYSMTALMFAFFPIALCGYWWPKISSNLLFLCAAITAFQAFGITGRTGDGMGAGLVGAIGLLGVPMLLTAFLFRWRSSFANLLVGK